MTKFKSFASAALTMTIVVSMVPAMAFAASDSNLYYFGRSGVAKRTIKPAT